MEFRAVQSQPSESSSADRTTARRLCGGHQRRQQRDRQSHRQRPGGRRRGGRIINISGVAGTSVLGDSITHGINNSALNHLTKYLARELADDQITVNAVVPGIVATEWREVWAENMGKQQGKTKAEFLDEYMRRIGILAGRWASMEEVSDMVVFLASDRARYINGTEIPVDGGYSVNAR